MVKGRGCCPQTEAKGKAECVMLAEVKQFKIDGKALTLSDANGNESLVYTAATAASPRP